MTHEVVRTEGFLSGIKNRILEKIARGAPGAQSFRPLLHRWRGVNMGKQVWIGYDSIIEFFKIPLPPAFGRIRRKRDLEKAGVQNGDANALFVENGPRLPHLLHGLVGIVWTPDVPTLGPRKTVAAQKAGGNQRGSIQYRPTRGEGAEHLGS